MTGKVPVITATISFGMGVDKASVRYGSFMLFIANESMIILEISF